MQSFALPKDRPYYSIKEVVAYFGFCRRTFERGVASGRYPRPLPLTSSGRCLRYKPNDIEAIEKMLEEERNEPPSP